MAAIKMTIVGLKAYRADMQKNARRLDAAVEKQMRRAAVVVRDQAKENVSGTGERTRALYNISQGRRTKRNPPGAVTAPADQLTVFEGRLRSSIDYELEKQGTVTTDAIIGTNVVYAPIHEYGGYAGPGGQAYIPPRPYLVKALQQRAEDVTALLRRALKVLK